MMPGGDGSQQGQARCGEQQGHDRRIHEHHEVRRGDDALAAGFAGDKVTSSTMTVNGFSMRCVDFKAAGIAGTSTICTTAQGILGYVKVASEATSFEIKAYSTSPPASRFELPPGATITAPPSGAAT